MSSIPLLHTPDEAAEILRCKPSWLKEQARKRRIPFTFIGGAYRFTNAHLEQIIRQFEQQPEDLGPAAAPRRKKTAEAATTGVAQLRARPPKRRAS
ncbi:helix-turn-helix domain-containing protein [Actinoallomurus spadix]|uniref:Helix-turn-helix domain-containing protein n=1 Tax=Actinoallomurus spadix TaxID=79912 RepID=A0ABP3H6L5_9ACTN|nr:helix-turn-helix domain-containing protein [Actinoallomurus spadix]MCO5987724.1 helix-turn-helix domain-containing protein [Actinoallomurus spadix]